MLELINWIKDGKHRITILKRLSENSSLPSELANKLDIDDTTVSRVLNQLKAKGLVDSVSKKSRTVTYFITNEGKSILKEIKK